MSRNLSRESLFKEPCEKYLQPQLCKRPRSAAHVDWAPQSPRRPREPGLGGACTTGVGRGLWEPGIQLLCCENAPGEGASETVVGKSTKRWFVSLNIQCCQWGFCVDADFILFILKFCDSAFRGNSLFCRLM